MTSSVMFSERCASTFRIWRAWGAQIAIEPCKTRKGYLRPLFAILWPSSGKAIVRHLVAFDTKRILNDLGGSVGVVGADGALEGWSCRGHCSEPLSHYSNHRN
jgi:hypothetical protein